MMFQKKKIIFSIENWKKITFRDSYYTSYYIEILRIGFQEAT